MDLQKVLNVKAHDVDIWMDRAARVTPGMSLGPSRSCPMASLVARPTNILFPRIVVFSTRMPWRILALMVHIQGVAMIPAPLLQVSLCWVAPVAPGLLTRNPSNSHSVSR